MVGLFLISAPAAPLPPTPMDAASAAAAAAAACRSARCATSPSIRATSFRHAPTTNSDAKFLPMASALVYPVRISAVRFHSVTAPVASRAMTGWGAESSTDRRAATREEEGVSLLALADEAVDEDAGDEVTNAVEAEAAAIFAFAGAKADASVGANAGAGGGVKSKTIPLKTVRYCFCCC